jgi:hypothetical protein
MLVRCPVLGVAGGRDLPTLKPAEMKEARAGRAFGVDNGAMVEASATQGVRPATFHSAGPYDFIPCLASRLAPAGCIRCRLSGCLAVSLPRPHVGLPLRSGFTHRPLHRAFGLPGRLTVACTSRHVRCESTGRTAPSLASSRTHPAFMFRRASARCLGAPNALALLGHHPQEEIPARG